MFFWNTVYSTSLTDWGLYIGLLYKGLSTDWCRTSQGGAHSIEDRQQPTIWQCTLQLNYNWIRHCMYRSEYQPTPFVVFFWRYIEIGSHRGQLGTCFYFYCKRVTSDRFWPNLVHTQGPPQCMTSIFWGRYNLWDPINSSFVKMSKNFSLKNDPWFRWESFRPCTH